MALIVTTSGCASWQGRNAVSRTFYNKTIIYKVNAGAEEHMENLESLQQQIYYEKEDIRTPSEDEESSLPDEIVVPLYRDTDTQRDHRITQEEAADFYEKSILAFEDSLGKLKHIQTQRGK